MYKKETIEKLNAEFAEFNMTIRNTYKDVCPNLSLHTPCEGGGRDYFGDFTYKAANIKKYGNPATGRRFATAAELVEDIKAYNETRYFPAHLYDPMYTEKAKVDTKLNYYITEVLGIQLAMGRDTYMIPDAYGKPVIEFSYHFNKVDSYKEFGGGHISRNVGTGFGFIDSEFSTLEEAIAIVNSIVESAILTTVVLPISVLHKMTAIRAYDKLEAKAISPATATLVSDHYVPMLTDTLRKLLEQLGTGQNG